MCCLTWPRGNFIIVSVLSEFYQFKARSALGKWQKLSRRHYVPNELQTHQDYIYRQGAAPRTRVLIPTQRRINLSSKIGFKRIVRSQKIHSFLLAWPESQWPSKSEIVTFDTFKIQFQFLLWLGISVWLAIAGVCWLGWRNLSITHRIHDSQWLSFYFDRLYGLLNLMLNANVDYFSPMNSVTDIYSWQEYSFCGVNKYLFEK